MAADKLKILIVEGKRAEYPSFFPGLVKKGFLVESVPNGSAALSRLQGCNHDLVLIDAASMRTSGKRICQAVKRSVPNVPIVVVIDESLKNTGSLQAHVILKQPFTLQKLLNRIRPLLPSDDKKLLRVGPLVMDPEQRWVRHGERQARLTPRLVTLLKILMDHQGEVIDRKDLFRRVWETNYTGDTRTLDVHISWLRQAIERDESKPRFIKTVRGVGYRLDIDAEDTQPLPRKRA